MSKESGVEKFYKCCLNVDNPNPKAFEVIDGKKRQWMCRSVVPVDAREGRVPKEVQLRPIGEGHGMIVCCERDELRARLTHQEVIA